MEQLNFHTNYSLLTAILPKESANEILKNAIPETISTDIIISARGAYYKDKWYQKFTPTINPEQTVFEILVPENLVTLLMDNISIVGKLQVSGIGAVYAIKCEKTLFVNPSDFSQKVEKISDEIVHYKNNLIGIFCIIQNSMAEKVATAAMRAGSPGPTIVFGQGLGIRDKLGLLRIAISPEKELIRVVVDSFDAEEVFTAMVEEGKLDTPGMGFIYEMPVENGLINIASVSAGKNQLASNQQIIKAIDEIKGGSAWRAHLGQNNGNKKKFLSNLSRLTCVVERGKGDALTKAAMNAGAPGASITYGNKRRLSQNEGSGISVNKEMEIIEMTLAPQKVDEIISVMLSAAEKENNKDIYFYTQPVPKALTYLG